MKVIQTIQGTILDPETARRPEPVEITYYNGDDIIQSMAALVTAAATTTDRWFTVVEVRLEF